MSSASAVPSASNEPLRDDGDYLGRVRELAPLIAEAAEEGDRQRRVPARVVDALIDAGLFRMLVPRSVGGAEVHPLTFVQVLEALAREDASVGWIVGQNAVCAIMGAYLAPDAARRILGDPRSVLAWGPAVSGARAIAEGDSYRVSGTWSLASGGRNATWLGGMCPILEADGTPRRMASGEPAMRVMLFPAGEAEWSDTWHVVGLRGTASDTYTVKDLVVPHAHSVIRDDTSENREPGWLYCFKATNLYACGFACVALGVARGLLDAFVALAMEKTPRGYTSPLRENAVVQSDLGHAEARLRAARMYLLQTLTETCEAVAASGEMTLERRVAIRLAATHTIREAVAVGDFAYESAGATAIFAANPFERRYRDLHTIVQQIQGRKSHYETAGRFLFGLEVGTAFL